MGNLETIQAEARAIAASKVQLGDCQTADDLVAAGLVGAAFGWSVATSANNLQVVNGKIGLRPESMLALIRQAGHSVAFATETDGDQVVAVVATGKRADTGDVDTARFGLADAKRAQLDGNTWRQYPESMMTWRATGMLARRLFGDCIAGVSYTPAELAAIDPPPATETGGVRRAHAKAKLVEMLGDQRAAAGQIWDRVMAGVDLPTSGSVVPPERYAALIAAAVETITPTDPKTPETGGNNSTDPSGAPNPQNAQNGRSRASGGEIDETDQNPPDGAETAETAIVGDSQASNPPAADTDPF